MPSAQLGRATRSPTTSSCPTTWTTAYWIAIARVNDRLYAFDDLCPCAREACPLSGSLLTGTTITCQCHGSRFDITTGAVINGPATEALTVYEVQEVNGTIHVRSDMNGATASSRT